MQYFLANEIKYKKIIEGLEWFKDHNPNSFHLFYGGEPLLRNDLSDIIKYCNQNNIYYTIISNGIDQTRIKSFFSEVGYVNGFTCSVDPIYMKNGVRCNTLDKSNMGFKTLKKFKSVIKDPVAEVTCDRYNIKYIYPLIEELSSHNIYSSVTVIDNKKNKYYDFSNISDNNLLISNDNEIGKCFEKLLKSDLKIHLPEILPDILKILPSNLDCEPIDRIKNLVIDSDGKMRLCLRIRGLKTSEINFYDYIKNNNFDKLLDNIQIDKNKMCSGCNWTCQLMLNKKIIYH